MATDFEIYFSIGIVSIVVLGAVFAYASGKRKSYQEFQEMPEVPKETKPISDKEYTFAYLDIVMARLWLAVFIILVTIVTNSFQMQYVAVYVIAIAMVIVSVVWYTKSFKKYSTPYDSTWQKFKLFALLFKYGRPRYQF